MTATPATARATTIGIVGLTPALAGALRDALHAIGFALGPLADGPDAVALVGDGPPRGDAAPAALVVLAQPGVAAPQLSPNLPVQWIDPPFTPERLLAAALGMWHATEARRAAGRLVALHEGAVAICAEPAREPDEIAAALAALLRDVGGYDDATVTLDGGDADGALPIGAIVEPIVVGGEPAGRIVIVPPEDAADPLGTAGHRRLLAAVAAGAAAALAHARRYADAMHLARFDQLTGLANRRYFLETLDRAIEAAARYDRPLALLSIDLDHFKSINDTFGHAAGDAVLRGVAGRLAERLRRSDFPARYAGDELAVILPETTLAGALTLAERLRAAVGSAPLPTGAAMPARLTLSIGVATRAPGMSADDLLRAADGALYFAKQEGRDRVRGPDAARAALDGLADDLATILRGGNEAVIAELAAAVDARVPESIGQGPLVAATAVALGAALGLGGSDLDTLRSAALVQDIGEIAIAPDTLGRPGPLGERELAIVRDHPRRSHELLAAVPAYREALPLILHHHERWDGGGFPDGLAGEAIPLGARLLAVADAWVALTTDRPYRVALPAPEALAEIARVAGTQLDPTIAALLPIAIGWPETIGVDEGLRGVA